MSVTRSMRRVLVPTLLVITNLAIASLALGDPGNGAERIPFSFGTFDLGPQYCGFPLHLGVVSNNQYVIHSTTLEDGTVVQRITGTFVRSITNTDTGKSITVNNGGPRTITTYPDGSFLTEAEGHSFFFLGPISQANTGLPGLVSFTGHVVVSFGGTPRAAQSFTLSGEQTSLCPLLAP